MMTKKKAPEPTLAERIDAFRAELERFIDEKTAALKRTRDGAELPLWDLRHTLTRGHSCDCFVVKRLLEESGDA
jgi:hypothetical protein